MKAQFLITCLSLVGTLTSRAQDPTLPPTNLGLANVYDGVVPKYGFIYQGFTQYFKPNRLYNDRGDDAHSNLKIASLLVMNQFIYLSHIKVLDGDLGFTVLIPIVQISSTNLDGPAPTANPNVLGDITQGVCIQWTDHHLFGKRFSHRAEVDLTTPTGSYDERYGVNPSAHLWSYMAYHSFTMILNKKFSVSARNQINYNSHILGTQAKPGAFYNGNYSVDYGLTKSWKIEVVSYFLAQINQDSYDGNHHYYQDNFGLHTTKEHVLGYGPGIAYFSPNGVMLEAKTFWETFTQNRFSGARPTLRIAIPLSK